MSKKLMFTNQKNMKSSKKKE